MTNFFYSNLHNIKIKNIDNRNYKKIKAIKLVVDDQKDLKRARFIASKYQIHNKTVQSPDEIISLALKYNELNK